MEKITKLSEYIEYIIQLRENDFTKSNDFNKSKNKNKLSNNTLPYYEYLLSKKEKPQGIFSRYGEIFFRGHSNKDYKLAPSIYRENNHINENIMYQEIMIRCPNDFKGMNYLDKLAIMQHYDMPTRLLDVTSNPLVALYFACRNQDVKQGKIYIFYTEELLYSDSDRVLMLSCIPKLKFQEQIELHNYIDSILKKDVDKRDAFPKIGSKYTNNLFERFYHEISRELPSFTRSIVPIDLVRPAFVKPIKTNRRLDKQDGAFIISGLCNTQDEVTYKLESLSQISIIVEDKERMVSELDIMGINEATLFPEIDRVSKYLYNCYKDRKM